MVEDANVTGNALDASRDATDAKAASDARDAGASDGGSVADGGDGGAPTVWSPTGGVPDDFRLVFERGACYGPCPYYRVTVDAQGHDHFAGQRPDKNANGAMSFSGGCSDRALSPERMNALLTALDAAHVFTMKPSGGVAMTDVSHDKLTVRANGRSRTLEDSGFGSGAGPKLEDAIDRITGAGPLSESDTKLRPCKEADGL